MASEIDLATLPGGEPAGTDMEYDSLYLELEKLAVGVPSREMGDSVVEGSGPDWKKLRDSCALLWQSTRDLRVAVFFTMAKTLTAGVDGMVEGLSAVNYLVSELWNDFWPRLDPEDDNDPLERLNILSMISPQQGAYDDPYQFINHFRGLRLVGRLNYTVRDMLIASGELENNDSAFDPVLFHAEMSGVPLTEFQARQAAAEKALALLESIAGTVNAKTDGRGTLNFSSICRELKTLRAFYAKYDSAEKTQTAGESAPAGAETETAAPSAPVAVRGTVDFSALRVASRSEALLLLKKSAEYFQTYEPTSPVPFLLSRAIRMAEMNFLDLLAEIDSNALPRGREQLGVLTGENQ